MKAWVLAGMMTALALWGAFPADAQAGNRAKAFSLTPMVGGYVFEGDQNLDNDETYGLALGYSFSSRWESEAVLNFTDTGAETGGGGDVEVYVYHLDALCHFVPEGPAVPYLALGLGGISFDGGGDENDDDFIVDYGLGLKYFFAEDFALRGDVRHVIAFEDPDHNLIYTLGLTWQLGGAKAPVPTERERDSDGDGVPDRRDQCPDTPKGVPVDRNGCPLDSDEDGVPDYRDKCPNTRKGEFVDEEGCTLKLTLHINFDLDKAEIKPEFKPDLERAARFIKKYEDVPYILIEGHTDWLGEEDYNQKLSERRAAAVRQYLIENYPIDPKRLVTRGYGESRPAADNSTSEGRYQNRRVEIICCVLPPEE